MAVGFVAHDAMELSGNDDGFAADVGLQEPSKHLFAGPGRIDISGVKEIDSEIKRLTKEGLALFFVQSPGMAARFSFTRSRLSIAHAAETNARNFEAGLAKIDVVHCFS